MVFLQRWFAVAAVVCLSMTATGVVSSCSGGDGAESETAAKSTTSGFDKDAVLRDRKTKDAEFRTSYSPLPSEQWADFPGLNYYDPTEEYYVPARLEVFEKPETVSIATTRKGEVRSMLRYGKFTFPIGDSSYSLVAYKSTGPAAALYPNLLFVPFTDKTTGVETYDAGRYLDVEIRPGVTEYYLDFNRAYNPYCAYNEGYTCPLVPAENALPVAVRAGEKNYGNH